MERIIKSMEDKYLQPSLELVESVLEHINGFVDYSFYDALHEG